MRTERLNLRVASDAEMRGLIAKQRDPDLRQAYTEMLEGSLAHPEIRDFYAVWMMETTDGTYIGDLSFKGVAPDGMVEIGYGTDPAFWNQGYTTEAVIALVNWALSQPGITRVEAETEPDNVASQRVLQKAGFVPTGTLGEEGPRFIMK